MDAVITKIAMDHIPSIAERGGLDERRNDEEDFVEVAVWEIKEALEAAYMAGRN